MDKKPVILIMIILFSIELPAMGKIIQLSGMLKDVFTGISREELFEIYSLDQLHAFRKMEGEESLTFDIKDPAGHRSAITFYINTENKVSRWKIADREEMVEQYMAEFIGDAVRLNYPQIHQALNNVFRKLPDEVFLSVTDRQRPVLFTVNITSGIAKHANATEFTMAHDDPPVFQRGFYLIKLGDTLETTGSMEAREGIIFHELAHRHLEHLRENEFSCEMERDANHLVAEWGFEAEYVQAKKAFGSRKKGDSPCMDELKEKRDKLEE